MLLYIINDIYVLLGLLGKSTHNQRIERLWRDVFQECLVLFYDIFSEFERCGLLDIDNDIQLWCLHHVFLPVVNRHLQSWKNAWVNHPLQTEKNSTPMQLWVKGLHSVYHSNSTVSREAFQVNCLVNKLLRFSLQGCTSV